MLHSTRLRNRRLEAHQTLAVRVDRPGGFDFQPGQYADLTVFNAGDRDALGPIRSLSIASVPDADYLEFIVRVRDTAFKRSLATLPIGADMLVEGPFDDLEFSREHGREMVFIAGGVGIAPFMSVLRETAAAGSALPATLFYSNRRPEDAAYLEELHLLEDDISGLRLVPTMTGMAGSSLTWEGETARLEMDLLERYLPSVVGPSYYIVGSPTLISQMRRTLIGAGVLDSDIGLEMYSGY